MDPDSDPLYPNGGWNQYNGQPALLNPVGDSEMGGGDEDAKQQQLQLQQQQQSRLGLSTSSTNMMLMMGLPMSNTIGGGSADIVDFMSEPQRKISAIETKQEFVGNATQQQMTNNTSAPTTVAPPPCSVFPQQPRAFFSHQSFDSGQQQQQQAASPMDGSQFSSPEQTPGQYPNAFQPVAPPQQANKQLAALNEVQVKMDRIATDLDVLVNSQAAGVRNFPHGLTPESNASFVAMQSNLKERAACVVRDLSTAWRQTVLLPPDIEKVKELGQDINVIMKRLDVLAMELQIVNNTAPMQQAAAVSLVLKRQPFPLVVRKGDQLSEGDTIIIQLLNPSAKQNCVTPVSPVMLQVLSDTAHSNARGNSAASSTPAHELMEPISVPVDASSGIAKFPLKFLDGTKNAPVSLKFSVQVKTAKGALVTLETDTTAPFIVTTHKDQWRGSAGSLLKREAFLNQLEVPWAQMANTLQSHFLRATKQPCSAPRRPLSHFDLMYLRKKFFNDTPMVGQAAFDSFWGWFGVTAQTIRHQRPILQLWLQGLVYGFASKEDVDIRLGTQEPGTFIVRCSESTPGSFGVAYSTYEGVKHYLVTAQDHALHKTLPDFILSAPKFVDVLQLVASKDNPYALSLVKTHKVVAYEPFCSKKTATRQQHPSGSGYTPL